MLFGLNTCSVPFGGSPFTDSFERAMCGVQLAERRGHWQQTFDIVSSACEATEQCSEFLSLLRTTKIPTDPNVREHMSVAGLFRTDVKDVTIPSRINFDTNLFATDNMLHPNITIFPFFPTSRYAAGTEPYELRRLVGRTLDYLLTGGSSAEYKLSFYIPAARNVLYALMCASNIYAGIEYELHVKELWSIMRNSTEHCSFLAHFFAYVALFDFTNIKEMVIGMHLEACVELRRTPFLTKNTCAAICKRVSLDSYEHAPCKFESINRAIQRAYEYESHFEVAQLLLNQQKTRLNRRLPQLAFKEFHKMMESLSTNKVNTYVTDADIVQSIATHETLVKTLQRQICIVVKGSSGIEELQIAGQWLTATFGFKRLEEQKFVGNIQYTAYELSDEISEERNNEIRSMLLAKPHLQIVKLYLGTRGAFLETSTPDRKLFAPGGSSDPVKGRTVVEYGIEMSAEPIVGARGVTFLTVIDFCCGELVKKHANLFPLIYADEIEGFCGSRRMPQQVKSEIASVKAGLSDKDAALVVLKAEAARAQSAHVAALNANAAKRTVDTLAFQAANLAERAQLEERAVLAAISKIALLENELLAMEQNGGIYFFYERARNVSRILSTICNVGRTSGAGSSLSRVEIDRIKYVPDDLNVSMENLYASPKFAKAVVHPRFVEFLNGAIVAIANVGIIGVCELFDLSRSRVLIGVGQEVRVYPTLNARSFCRVDQYFQGTILQAVGHGSSQLSFSVYQNGITDLTGPYRNGLKSLKTHDKRTLSIRSLTTQVLLEYVKTVLQRVEAPTGLAATSKQVAEQISFIISFLKGLDQKLRDQKKTTVLPEASKQDLISVGEYLVKLEKSVYENAHANTSCIKTYAKNLIAPSVIDRTQTRIDHEKIEEIIAALTRIHDRNELSRTAPKLHANIENSLTKIQDIKSNIDEFETYECVGKPPSCPRLAALLECSKNKICLPLLEYCTRAEILSIFGERMVLAVEAIRECTFELQMYDRYEALIMNLIDLIDDGCTVWERAVQNWNGASRDDMLSALVNGMVANTYTDLSFENIRELDASSSIKERREWRDLRKSAEELMDKLYSPDHDRNSIIEEAMKQFSLYLDDTFDVEGFPKTMETRRQNLVYKLVATLATGAKQIVRCLRAEYLDGSFDQAEVLSSQEKVNLEAVTQRETEHVCPITEDAYVQWTADQSEPDEIVEDLMYFPCRCFARVSLISKMTCPMCHGRFESVGMSIADASTVGAILLKDRTYGLGHGENAELDTYLTKRLLVYSGLLEDNVKNLGGTPKVSGADDITKLFAS